MGAIVTHEPCLVCEVHEPIMHSHHTTPQCRGGVNSPQVILCPTCHNLIHAQALHLVSCIRKNTTPVKRFWRSAGLEDRAAGLVQTIVRAFLEPLPTDVQVDIPLTLTVDAQLQAALQLLHLHLGLSSMEKTIRYCVTSMLERKGIKNDKQAPMWFLPGS